MMRSTFYSFRAVLATGVSLWMAVLACLMGCTILATASEGATNASFNHHSSVTQNEPDMMADMPNCPHHSSDNAPAKPVRGGGMSCCPVEVTIASKPHPVTFHIAPDSDFVPAPDLTIATIRIFHVAEFVPPVWHSGRDTLLETQLLRI